MATPGADYETALRDLGNRVGQVAQEAAHWRARCEWALQALQVAEGMMTDKQVVKYRDALREQGLV